MEVNCQIYKDPKTGKIYQQIGGQDPIEIDETFAKILHLDIDSIPVLEKKNNDRVICPFCGTTVPRGKFCPECGTLLTEVSKESEEQRTIPSPEQKIGFFSPLNINDLIPSEAITEANMPGQGGDSEESQAVDDSGLTLLGEFCKKTMATVGGDGYDEIVLYENEADGSFQIHTYLKYAFMQKENHHSFKAKNGAYAALLKLVEKLKLNEYEGKSGIGLCGGMYICKYKKDGVLHTVTTDNLGTDGTAIIIQVGNLLGSFKGDEITK